MKREGRGRTREAGKQRARREGVRASGEGDARRRASGGLGRRGRGRTARQGSCRIQGVAAHSGGRLLDVDVLLLILHHALELPLDELERGLRVLAACGGVWRGERHSRGGVGGGRANLGTCSGWRGGRGEGGGRGTGSCCKSARCRAEVRHRTRCQRIGEQRSGSEVSSAHAWKRMWHREEAHPYMWGSRRSSQPSVFAPRKDPSYSGRG